MLSSMRPSSSRRWQPCAIARWRSPVFVKRGVGGARSFLQPDHVAQDAALVFKLCVFAGLRSHGLDFIALKGPQIGLPQLFLRGAVQFGKFSDARAPRGKAATLRVTISAAPANPSSISRWTRRKKLLLIVLAMDIAQVTAPVP